MARKRTRLGYWLAAVLVLASLPLAQLLVANPEFEDGPQSFSHSWLQEYARELAGQDYESAEMAEDNPLRLLSYDDYRRIVFDPEASIWRDEDRPFQLQMFLPGFLHTTPVRIHLVSDGEARRLAFASNLFTFQGRALDLGRLDAGGFAGFRVHHPINTPDRYEEFLVFLGASYFRAVGAEQFYGISARGLAINTVGGGGEEFPRFSEFWIEQPDSGADEIVIHALLDSPSVTGAYQFTVYPGDDTMMDVEVSLFPRQDRERVGIAPLTSMFMYDATNRTHFDDFRNAVHDSDGLQILEADGEQIWRPLANPFRLQVSAFGADRELPVGFGLMQRRNQFSQFNDDEARYDKRPSLWIEPLNDWGDGHVELVEIPTGVEYHDNVVAYWQPQGGLETGQTYHYRYRMHWGADPPYALDAGRVVDTSSGTAIDNDDRVFVIDYSGGEEISDTEAVRINASTSEGTITNVSGTLIGATGRYRAYVRLDPEQAELAELRVTLEVEGEPWGETWLYRWTP
ncbi:MAG: glucan biosynthesis protein G [Natronospirillum sp.]|uniref:glucan biosynthesis protein n=1 Tax=Natronospirillum sp. TaxID=2812955 RepID=UPI0025D029EF|nr:glucan biosynthesis protein G [Natronospirillum sp.]MCH8551911.1 glucan biosynthesis protein G [Natronospirillum sp.]